MKHNTLLTSEVSCHCFLLVYWSWLKEFGGCAIWWNSSLLIFWSRWIIPITSTHQGKEEVCTTNERQRNWKQLKSNNSLPWEIGGLPTLGAHVRQIPLALSFRLDIDRWGESKDAWPSERRGLSHATVDVGPTTTEERNSIAFLFMLLFCVRCFAKANEIQEQTVEKASLLIGRKCGGTNKCKKKKNVNLSCFVLFFLSVRARVIKRWQNQGRHGLERKKGWSAARG